MTTVENITSGMAPIDCPTFATISPTSPRGAIPTPMLLDSIATRLVPDRIGDRRILLNLMMPERSETVAITVGNAVMVSEMGRAHPAPDATLTGPRQLFLGLFFLKAPIPALEKAGLKIEGDRNARVRLYHQKWDARKVWLRAVKWTVWLLIGLATGGAWIFYFTDAPTLLVNLIHGTAHPVAYITMGILTFTTFFFGGVAREQICIYACPWPRIQAAMMDEDTLTVAYRDWRGEPRGKLRKIEDETLERQGDCIDCLACVNVCPMGIDIRKGQQMECITCALCIDACDSVMTQIGRPRGLIDYATLEDCKIESEGGTPRPITKALFHTRTLIYVGVWAAIGFALLFALGTRKHIDISVQKDRNPPYTVEPDGAIRNDYTVKLLNMEGRPRPMQVRLEGLPGGLMWTDDMPQSKAAPVLQVMVPADQVRPVRVYVIAPGNATPRKIEFALEATDKEGGEDSSTQRFDAPEDNATGASQ